jgi:hypothetical protein
MTIGKPRGRLGRPRGLLARQRLILHGLRGRARRGLGGRGRDGGQGRDRAHQASLALWTGVVAAGRAIAYFHAPVIA